MKCSLIIFGVLACWAAPIYARRSSAAENNRQKQYLRNIEAVCAGHPDWTIVPNINDCRKFFVCINREYEEMQCAEGHHFDRISGRCASGYCANTGPTSKCQPHEVRRVADDCTAFLSCQRGSFVRNQCPAGRYFDATYSSCQPIANNPRHQCSCIMPEYTALPNNDDCSTYYTCNEGRAKLHQCPRGQFYSEDVSSCLPDLTGQCVMAPTMSPLEMPVDNVVCPEAYTSFHAHEADCNKFYLCVNGNAYVKECEKGFFFDETVRFCRFDVRQTCEKRNTMDHELPEEGLQQTDDIKNKDKHHLSGGIVVLGYHPHHNNNVDQHEENEAPIVEEHPDYQDVKPLFANQHLLAPVYDYVKEHLAGPEVAISEVPAPIDLDMKPVYVDLHLTEPLQILPPTDEEYYLQQIDADIPDLDEIQPPVVDSLLGHLHHFANEHLNKPLINQPEPLQVDQHLVDEQHQQEPLKADQHSAHHHHVESHDHSESSHSANKPQQSITDTHKQEHTGVMVLGYHHTKNEDHHQVKPVEYENQHAHHPREADDHEHEAKVHMNYHKHDESIEEPEDDSETFSVPEGDKLNNFAGSHMKNEVHTSQEAYKPQTYSAYDKLSSKFMKF